MLEHECVPDESIQDPVERLKALADCYWHLGELDKIFAIGQQIIAIGEQNSIFSKQALGHMVCGDARMSQQRYSEAWEFLDKSTQLFTLAAQVGEEDAEFHRARTAIGKLVAAVGEDKAAQAHLEYESARIIFSRSTRPEAPEKLATLYQNAGIFFWRRGQFEAAHNVYELALELIRAGKVQHAGLEPMIMLQIGHIYGHQGMARESATYFDKALELCQCDPHLLDGIFIAHQNLAITELSRGLYQEALDRLTQNITAELGAQRSRLLDAQRIIIECFLALNNYRDAVDLAQQLVNMPDQLDQTGQSGPALVFLATAQAELGFYDEAEHHFHQAFVIFETSGFLPQTMLIQLRLAQLRFQRQDYAGAQEQASEVLRYCVTTGHTVQEADARLLLAHIAHLNGATAIVTLEECQAVLLLADKCDSFRLRYDTYVLMGHVAQRSRDFEAAVQHYKAALQAVDQVQRHLAIAFRPSFLSDKGEALRALVRLYLANDHPDAAFEAIEQSRAQVFLRYLTTQRPVYRSYIAQGLAKRLSILRQDFMSYSNTATPDVSLEQHDDAEPGAKVRSTARQKATEIGQELQNVTRKLHRFTPASTIDILRLRDLQPLIEPDKTLLAYYDDGEQIIGFVIQADGTFYSCPIARTADVKRLIQALDVQINFALSSLRLIPKIDVGKSGDELLNLPAFNQPTLKRSLERVSGALYDALIRPLLTQSQQPLTIVPYGLLHFVPFHLLYDTANQRYLIQDHDINIMPTASLIGQPTTKYPAKAVIIWDDLGGKLRHSRTDAENIAHLLDNQRRRVRIYSAGEALAKGVFQNSTGEILHIIAHAQFDSLHPEKSFIELDGQRLRMSDLIGRTLCYRLIVLTACETGQLHLAEREGRGLLGDDLVGLGRAFLYTGARSVLASRWLIGDGMTLPLLQTFYQGLNAGETLAASLRQSETKLSERTNLHPAFWGVFQLMGNGESFYNV